MEHYLYCSSGNSLGIDEYIGLFEIGDDGFCKRYLEIKATEVALRYTEEHPADRHGFLPEGNWSEHEAELSKAEYGTLTTISPALFEAVWSSTGSSNNAKRT